MHPRALAPSRIALVTRIILVAVLATHAAMALFVIASRIRHPYDLEWMTGAVLDHVERVRAGKPLYIAPSSLWVPLLYPPLFYWFGAVVGGGAFACRMISVVATVAQGVFTWSAARALGATRFWAAVSVFVFVAAFSFVGFWYDLERCDNLFGAFVLAASVVLLRARTLRAHVLAGALFAIATLAKQQAVFYLAGAGLGLLLATRASDDPARRRDVVAFVVAAALPLVVLVAYAYAGEGWAAYYLVHMPRVHGLVMSLTPSVIARDLPGGFLLIGVTLATASATGLQSLRGNVIRNDVVAAGILTAGFAGAIASRLHIGGWFNVLIPWTTCAAVAVGVVASRLEERRKSRSWHVGAMVAVVGQLLVWLYDPRDVVPKDRALATEQHFLDEIRALEREGEVLVPARGHLTRVRHFHISALADAARVEGHSPPDLVRALREREYAAVVDDARYEGFRATDWPPIILEDLDDLRPALLSAYFVARCIDEGDGPLALTSPATPRWVYRPRRVVLDVEASELRRRQVAEMRLAERRAKLLGQGKVAPFSEGDIESLAEESNAASDAEP